VDSLKELRAIFLSSTEETKNELYLYYSQISNNDTTSKSEKWMGLKSLGLSDEEVNTLCTKPPYTEEEIWAGVSEELEAERKELRKFNTQCIQL
jgi:hypothetical protein